MPSIPPRVASIPVASRPAQGVGRYAPIRLLSSGPEGTAILASDPSSGALVELRHINAAQANPVRLAELESVARVYAMLAHPSWMPLLELERTATEHAEAPTPVLVLGGYVERDLLARLTAGPLPAADALHIVERLAHALGAAHRLGLVHGRVGPSRVRLQDDGTPLLDFAWADVGGAFTADDAACRPPESVLETLDASSDVFALGKLLVLLLTGSADGVARLGDAACALVEEMTSERREARPTAAEVCLAVRAMRRDAQQTSVSGGGAVVVTLDQPAGSGTTTPSALRSGGNVEPGVTLGRFHLLAKLGEGGMGQVFRAVDLGSGAEAAVKVLHPSASADPVQLQRFRKEARMLAQVDSPYVARLLELNRDGDVHYLALELVEGGDLAQVAEAQGGRLEEREALSIIADVCRGLGEAHVRGIVHRDIKPENVMIARKSSGAPDDAPPVVKLCDFGIARGQETQGSTLAMTQAGSILGTPMFMAPEQCFAAPVTPATDVYALGVTLFLLISGRAPFENDEAIALMLAHVNSPPPVLAEVCAEASAATSALVARCLAKNPSDRFVDATALLEGIERVLGGEPTDVALHPVRPSAAALKRIVQHVFEWDLKATPEALWPFVSNTDRLNRAVGVPPASFDRGTEKTVGSNRIAGVDLRWQEHPFEWVEGRRWGVLRVFDKGVMDWFTITLELSAKPEGGTRLRYTMTFEPRHWLGKLIVGFEMKMKQRPALGRAFARIDAIASSSVPRAAGVDPFEVPPALSATSRLALDSALAKLRSEGVAAPVVDAITAFCESASAQEITRLRPLAFARDNALDPDAVVDACLRGAHHGMFTLLWEVLCPLCRIPSGFADSLKALADHGRCVACSADFALDFTQSLELVFRVAPAIRASELRTYCIGGPAFSPHVVAQVRLAPGERLALDLALDRGAYRIRSPQLAEVTQLEISRAAPAHRGEAIFTQRAKSATNRVLLGPGSQLLTLANELDREIVVRVERSAGREDALTAARASCLASFRRLFPGEVLASGRLVAVGRTAFLVTSLHAQRELLAKLGDANAFERVLAQFDVVAESVEAEGGALVKRFASGATLSAFESAAAASRAAVQLRAALSSKPETLDVRIAVHQGAAVAATFDGRLDYFGRSVETAIELVDSAPADGVLLSAAIAEDAHAMSDLTTAGHTITLLELGVSGDYGVVVTPALE